MQLIQDIAAVLTVLTGLVALIRPRAITGFTGLEPVGGRGITEIRTIFGALFVALGAVPLLTREPSTYWMLGVTYLSLAVVRTVSIFLDRSPERSNYISVAAELVLGILLVL